jgi:hypothetical protein
VLRLPVPYDDNERSLQHVVYCVGSLGWWEPGLNGVFHGIESRVPQGRIGWVRVRACVRTVIRTVCVGGVYGEVLPTYMFTPLLPYTTAAAAAARYVTHFNTGVRFRGLCVGVHLSGEVLQLSRML